MNIESFQKIYESKNSILYKGKYENFDHDVIVKILNSEYPTEEQIVHFNNEYEYTNNLKINGVRQVLKKNYADGKYILVLEYFQGKTLKEFFSCKPVVIADFLKVAITISQIIGDIHKKNIIHKDINSQNILVSKSGEVRIIDFGISSKYNIKKQNLSNPEYLDGTLAYISPEQTGRMNRTVDYRTDLYSLGVVLYEAFTGKLPFSETDSMQVIHAHIARTPVPPHKINANIPGQLSEIILKLLAKNAENRYQSAFGLKHDLIRLAEQLNQSEIVFQLGEKDFSGRLSIPEKLYGRNDDIKLLMDLYENVCEKASALLTISGLTGVGKSALVHEIHKPVTHKKGIYIEGKFDQFQKNIPYYAIVQAFTDAANLLLKENDNRFNYWKNIIENALGKSGKVISDLIPELELIIGKQPELPKLEGKEAQNRFHYVWAKFIKAICTPEHPIVLFIDDVQWADSSSLNLLKVLLTDKEIKHFLCITAYRDNETDATHPFIQLIEELKEEKVHIETLKLENLKKEDINHLLVDALYSESWINAAKGKSNFEENTGCEKLSEIIYEKTLGNAFFTTQFLKILYEEGLLHFDFDKNIWIWDLFKIQQKNITDNVLELMTNKVLKLKEQTQDVLKIAACIGNRFDINLLSAVYSKSEQDTRLDLEPAIYEGLILPLDYDHYKFVHDRIQNAVYSTIPTDKKNNFHFQTGMLLLFNIPGNKQEKRIFDIVNQLNFGLNLGLEKDEEKIILAELNYKAGLKAKFSTAYETAYKYLKTAESLLPENSWEINYQLTLEIYNELTEISYLNAEYKQTEEYVRIIDKNAQEVIDTAKAYFSLLNSLRAQAKYEEAVQKGVEISKKLGVKIPKVSKLQLILNLVRTNIATNKDFEKLTALPVISDKYIHAAIKVLDAIGTSAFNSNPQLLALFVLKVVRLTMKYGYAESSPYSISAYGMILSNLNRIEKSLIFGNLATFVHEKHNFFSIKCKTAHMNLFFISTYKKRIHDLLPDIYRNYQTGMETGDFEFAGFSIMFFFGLSIYCRTNLKELKISAEKHKNQIVKLSRDSSTKAFLYFIQLIEDLNAENYEMHGISGSIFNEEAEVKKLRESKAYAMIMRYYQSKLFVLYLFNRPEEIEPLLPELEEHKNIGQGYYFHTLLNFYKSLCLLDIYDKKGPTEKRKILKTVKINQKQMKIWAKHCPENFKHKFQLVEALRMKVIGNINKAKYFFDQSIEGANTHEFIQEEALAWEATARFYFEQNQNVLGRYYLQNAYRCYHAWGALAKLKQMETKYPNYISTLLLKSTIQDYGNKLFNNSGSETGNSLDLNSIIRASQYLSGEVNFERLLKSMLMIVMENAGAEYAVFIKNDDENFAIQAKGKYDEKNIEVMQSEAIEQSGSIPLSIIKYVIRTHKSMVLNNAFVENQYLDAYFQKNKVKSAFCHPIIHKNKLVAVLYLENNLSSYVFTKERIETVNILSSQIAVSIENALLYENLEDKVNQRTTQLQKAKEELEKSHKNITDSINYASRIQTTILPEKQIIDTYFPENFILDKPKDIVSGDFYWFAHFNGITYMAAVDCTGHGVPGAFMSIIGNNILNKAVFEQKITEPNQILNFLSSEIRNSLRKKLGDTSVKDGMDLILCAFCDQNKILKFAGVHNPLVMIRKNKILNYKTDSFEIGAPFTEEFQSYNQQEIKLQNNDLIYIFSDGFADQPGEESGTKYLSKNFRDTLFKMHTLPLNNQRDKLDQIITEWKGNKVQIDDILVIGLKLSHL